MLGWIRCVQLKEKINSCLCIRFDPWTINSPSFLYSLKDLERLRIMCWAPYMLKLENALIALALECFLSKPRQNDYERALTERLLKTCWLQKEAGGAWCVRKTCRRIAEPRGAQAWGESPSFPSHRHKKERHLVMEKVYLKKCENLALG